MMRALLAMLLSILTACSPIFDGSDCADTLVSATTSADGNIVANTIRRDCGATTAFSNIVFLKKSNDASGTDGKWGDKVYVLQGEVNVTVQWSGKNLKIKAPPSGKDVFLRRDEWAEIKIVYE
ncbi:MULTISPECIES: hypothetical protein [unclassified Rhizobacter]|uniref:hypothetical protein n=1 Tax=unclassified Rhizobacter TaxID=2640088 RepID=UPI0012F93C67|nr:MULTISPECIES: hypothetical protein [unclassified Rhizobacter]